MSNDAPCYSYILMAKEDIFNDEITKEQVLRNQLNIVISTNSMLTARLQNANYNLALMEKKLIEYEKKISEFNQLKWYQKIKYKF